eukprot:5072351-Pleurochrysis_carterae.AAC.1
MHRMAANGSRGAPVHAACCKLQAFAGACDALPRALVDRQNTVPQPLVCSSRSQIRVASVVHVLCIRFARAAYLLRGCFRALSTACLAVFARRVSVCIRACCFRGCARYYTIGAFSGRRIFV